MRLTTGSGSRRDCHDDDARVEPIASTIVVVLPVTLGHGTVSVGLTRAAKATITQTAAEGQAAKDVAGIGKGTWGTTFSSINLITYGASDVDCASRSVDTCVTRAVTDDSANASPFHDFLVTGIIARAPWRPVLPSKVPLRGNRWRP